MLLHEKLRHLRSAIVTPTGGTTSRAERPSRRPDLEHLLQARVRETDLGTCLVAEQRFPPEHRHGRLALGDGRQASRQALALLGRARSVPCGGLERAVFLDTETTGLSGGTGTYVFLVGAGWFEGDAFVVRQVFMRDHAEEAALLAAVRDLVARFELVVTFNGKSFDLPLLQTRYALARQPSPLDGLLHLDLLHPARRVWRHCLDNCRLASLEEHLGHRREQDVPSWAIPSLYFAYVRGGDAAPMARVFQHNLQDVLSLVTLAARLAALLERPLADGWSAEEVYQAGRLLEEAGHTDQAMAAYAHASELAGSQTIGQAAALRLAALHKRAGRWDLAASIWARLAASASPYSLQASVELAKHFEHRARDPAAALRHTLRALERVEMLEALRPDGQTTQRERQAIERRLARLLKKR